MIIDDEYMRMKFKFKFCDDNLYKFITYMRLKQQIFTEGCVEFLVGSIEAQRVM